jgi:hypothetical protein
MYKLFQFTKNLYIVTSMLLLPEDSFVLSIRFAIFSMRASYFSCDICYYGTDR